MKKLVLIAALLLAGCGEEEKKLTPEEQVRFEMCMTKGLQYLKDVEHFPYMKRDKVRSNLVTVHTFDMCYENPGAFGSLEVNPNSPVDLSTASR